MVDTEEVDPSQGRRLRGDEQLGPNPRALLAAMKYLDLCTEVRYCITARYLDNREGANIAEGSITRISGGAEMTSAHQHFARRRDTGHGKICGTPKQDQCRTFP